MATPKTLRNPAAKTANHNKGRTSADTRRPYWRTNFASSRVTMAHIACR